MLEAILKKVIGSKNDRELKRYAIILEEINDLEPAMMAASDAELKSKTETFRKKINNGGTSKMLL